MFSRMVQGRIEYRRTSSIKHRTKKESGRQTLYWRNTFLRNELKALSAKGMVVNHTETAEMPTIAKTTQFQLAGEFLVSNFAPTELIDDDEEFSVVKRTKFQVAEETRRADNFLKKSEKVAPKRYWYGAGRNQPSYQTVVKRIMEDYDCDEKEARRILTENV